MFAPENMSVKKFLEMAPEPPPPLAIDHSMEFLEVYNCLNLFKLYYNIIVLATWSTLFGQR